MEEKPTEPSLRLTAVPPRSPLHASCRCASDWSAAPGADQPSEDSHRTRTARKRHALARALPRVPSSCNPRPAAPIDASSLDAAPGGPRHNNGGQQQHRTQGWALPPPSQSPPPRKRPPRRRQSPHLVASAAASSGWSPHCANQKEGLTLRNWFPLGAPLTLATRSALPSLPHAVPGIPLAVGLATLALQGGKTGVARSWRRNSTRSVIKALPQNPQHPAPRGL